MNFTRTSASSVISLQSSHRRYVASEGVQVMLDSDLAQIYGYETKDFNRQVKNNIERFDEINTRLADYSLKATFLSSITNPATRFVNSTVYACVTLFGAFMALNGHITVGILSSFLAYATQYTKPFNEISGVVTELQNAVACAGRIIGLIEEKEVEPNTPEKAVLNNAKGNIKIDSIDFSYVPEIPLIEDFSLITHYGVTPYVKIKRSGYYDIYWGMVYAVPQYLVQKSLYFSFFRQKEVDKPFKV